MKKVRWTFLDHFLETRGSFIPQVFWRGLTVNTFPEGCFSPLVLLALAVGIQLTDTFIAPGNQPPFVDI